MTGLSREAIQDIFLEFSESLIHFILFARSLYPSSLFESVNIYGFPTRVSRHPSLNAYIRSFLAKIKSFQELKTHFKIFLIIYNHSSEQCSPEIHSEKATTEPILEKYQIEMDLTAFLDQYENRDGEDARSNLTIDDLRRSLRSIILKLSTTWYKLSPITPEHVYWKLWLELPDAHADSEKRSIDSILADQGGGDASHYFLPSSNSSLQMDSSARLHTLSSLDLCGGKGPRYEVVVSESVDLKKLGETAESVPVFSIATGSTTKF